MNGGRRGIYLASMVLRVSILVFQTRGSASISGYSLHNNKEIEMTKKKEEILREIVSPLDAEAAISDILNIIHNRGMSTTDLAVELGWKRNKVDEFLYGVDVPKKSEFEAVAKVLEYELEFEEE